MLWRREPALAHHSLKTGRSRRWIRPCYDAPLSMLSPCSVSGSPRRWPLRLLQDRYLVLRATHHWTF